MTTNQSDAGPSTTRQLTREELQRKIDKYSTRLREYAGHGTEDAKGKEKALIDSTQKAHQKIVSLVNQTILEQMLLIMDQCNAKGFVYRMVTETSKPITGASDNLCAWWKRQAMFHQAGPAHIDQYYKDNLVNSNVSQDSETKSTTELLMELSDPTLGSIISLLLQHCNPPQRKFLFVNGVPPPWWPTTQEDWWGQTGISRYEGPPPSRKPHDLRKKWKVVVIVGVIKSMSPNFSGPYNLVEQSHHLRLGMNAKERKFWTLAVVVEAKQYCREHPDMPVDEAIAFVETYRGGSSSKSGRTLVS